MKASIFFALGLAALSNAHCIAQRVRVAGQDQGQMKGIRAPNNNNPLLNVQDANMACNQNQQQQPVDKTVINVAAGQQVSIWWQHVSRDPKDGRRLVCVYVVLTGV